MERRVLLAVALSFLVLFGYQALVVKPTQKPRPSTPAAATPSASAPVEAPAAAAAPEAAPGPAIVTGEATERRIVVETSRVRATFSNRGGLLESWLLKDYLDSQGRPMDLVPQELTNPAHHPLAITVGDAALSDRLNTARFKASSGE